jgi:hypothetical protein
MSDLGGLDDLAADMTTAARRIATRARPVTSRGAVNIKNDWKAGWEGLAHAPRLPGAINYDLGVHDGMPSAEIGPDTNKLQGSLGNLLEFGSVNNAPHPAGLMALDAEEPRYEAALEALLDGLL